MARTEDLGIQGIDDIEPLDVEDSAMYRAHQAAENRMVVVKLLDPRQQPVVPRRFDLRNNAINQFAQHPGVVPVHDSGVTASGQRYLIMPYYRIGSLADQLAHGPMPWHRAAELTLRAAETVAFAHELDLVLGDLKPSSIILADASSPLVSVYGMATKRFGDSNSPSYASPEVQRGEQLFPSADVYSLTLTLAALIAGRPPNRGPLSSEFVDKVRSLAADRIFEVIDHGLTVHQANRYGTCRHLAQALAAAIGGDPTEAPRPVTRPQPDEPFDLDAILGPPAPSGKAGQNGTGTASSNANANANAHGKGNGRATEQRPGPRSRPRAREPLRPDDGGAAATAAAAAADSAATTATAAFDDAAGIIGAATGLPMTNAVSSEPEPTASHPAIGARQDVTVGSANGTRQDASEDPVTTASGTTADSSTSNMPSTVSQEPEPTASHPAIGADQAATKVAVATSDSNGVAVAVADSPVSQEPEPTASHPAVGSEPPPPSSPPSPPEATTNPAPPPTAPDATDSAAVSEEPEPTASHPAIGNDTGQADQPTVQAPNEPQPAAPSEPPPIAPSEEAPPRGAPVQPPIPSEPPIPGQPPIPGEPPIQGQPPVPGGPPSPGQPPAPSADMALPPASSQTPPRQAGPAPGQPIPPSQQLPPNRQVAPGRPTPGRPSSDYGRAGFESGGPRPSDPGRGEHRQAGYDRPVAPPAPPAQHVPHQGVQRRGHDVPPMPFRGFERREMYQEPGNPISRLLDSVLSLVSERRSSGTLLAVLGLVLVATVVGALVIRDFTGGTDDGAVTPSLPSGSTGSTASTFPPTNVAPILVEPPRTNSTAPTTSPATIRRTTTEPAEDTTTSEATTTSEGSSSSDSTPTSRSTTTDDETTSSETSQTSSSATTSDTASSSSRPATTDDPDPTISLPTVPDD